MGHMGYVDGQAHRCWSIMDSYVCYTVQPLPLPSLAIHLRTATTPALTVTLSDNVDGSALGGSGEVGWVFGFGGVGLVIVCSHIGLGMI
jgi:hypothetical protein